MIKTESKSETSTEQKSVKKTAIEPTDAKRGEVILYAFGNVENAFGERFPLVLQNILVVALHVNPLLIGLVLAIKTFWDSITDPIMAHITDNTRSRWGRRRPYILVGGVLRMLLLVAFIAFMPTGGRLTTNAVMEAQKNVNEVMNDAESGHTTALKAYQQFDSMDTEAQERIRGVLEGVVTDSKEAAAILTTNIDVLQAADKNLFSVAEEQRVALDENTSLSDKELEMAEGRLASAEEKYQSSTRFIQKSVEAQRRSIAARAMAQYVLDLSHVEEGAEQVSPELAQAKADQIYGEAGLERLDIFEAQNKPLPVKRVKKRMWASMQDGVTAFLDAKNIDQRGLIMYVLVGLLLFTTLTTVNSVPYFALGIELSPSYNGRTQVFTYRAVMNKIAGLLQPWVPVFCFSLAFTTALNGLFWITVGVASIGIPSTVLMCIFTRERTQAAVAKKEDRVNLFRSMGQIVKCPDFLRVAGLFIAVTTIIHIFSQLSFYLNVYWVMGSALSGAKMGAWVQMMAWGLAFFSLPLINWGCRRFEKHKVLRFALIWMAIGASLKWWCMNPDHPEYQFILPLFYSVGIGSIYSILPNLLADVTDVDELKYGVRREGMFGAANGFLMKLAGTVSPIIAGVVLVVSGFDPALGYSQAESTILKMRLFDSFVPAVLLLLALLLLFRYPLTRKRVEEIKETLRLRREEKGAEAQ